VTPDDRISIVLLLALGLLVLLADIFEPPLRAFLEGRRRARWRREEIARARQDLLLPFGCGCCGQDCPEGRTWCLACEPHVGVRGALCERTYYALHGVDCPFAAKPPEEVRLMPGYEQRDTGDESDVVTEGLGIPGDPVVRRARPSPVTPGGALDPSTQRAVDELHREAHS